MVPSFESNLVSVPSFTSRRMLDAIGLNACRIRLNKINYCFLWCWSSKPSARIIPPFIKYTGDLPVFHLTWPSILIPNQAVFSFVGCILRIKIAVNQNRRLLWLQIRIFIKLFTRSCHLLLLNFYHCRTCIISTCYQHSAFTASTAPGTGTNIASSYIPTEFPGKRVNSNDFASAATFSIATMRWSCYHNNLAGSSNFYKCWADISDGTKRRCFPFHITVKFIICYNPCLWRLWSNNKQIVVN